MARGKKKEELALEKKLERALVPVDEQPYEVPENWCWTYLKNIAQWSSGGTPSRKNSRFYEGNIPWVKTGELEDNYLYDTEEKISEEAIQKSSAKLFPIESVLIAMYGATIGKTAILGVEAATNQACACAVCNDSVYNKYLFYYLRSQKDNFIEQGKGGAQPNISQNIIKNNCIPLPSKAEQQRIVEQIEGLFAKLNEAKEKIAEVKESYLVRKAAILSQAFVGKLTSEWREQNNISDTWTEKTFGEIAIIKSNLVKPNEYLDFPHIAPDNIEKRTGVLLQYNTIAEDRVTSGKHRFYPGQILYSKIRPYLSKVVMVDFDGLCSADMYPIEAKENTRYLWYYMLSDDFLEQASSAGSRSVLPKINKKELSELLVNIPSIKEQEEVVKILDRLLPYEQKVVECAEVVLGQIDVMKKTILSKAFRGELGTNNPAEESSIELLKKILSKV